MLEGKQKNQRCGGWIRWGPSCDGLLFGRGGLIVGDCKAIEAETPFGLEGFRFEKERIVGLVENLKGEVE